MHAVQVKAFGGPEVLGVVEVGEPVPGDGEVVVEVAYVDTIFVETQIRRGLARAYFPVVPPYVPGGGVSGTVAAVGAGVDAGWVGRRVVCLVDGSYAERVIAPVGGLVPVPDGLDLRTAAAPAHDGVTAAGLLERTAVSPCDRVLVLGASGGMGTLLVQAAGPGVRRWSWRPGKRRSWHWWRTSAPTRPSTRPRPGGWSGRGRCRAAGRRSSWTGWAVNSVRRHFR